MKEPAETTVHIISSFKAKTGEFGFAKMLDCDSGAQIDFDIGKHKKLTFFLFHFLTTLPAIGPKVTLLKRIWPSLKLSLCLGGAVLVASLSDFVTQAWTLFLEAESQDCIPGFATNLGIH